ncbi:MAG TPA: serine/threonine-protein kinase [Candidatus Cryosericum sp.]|nr:serine/threonine-protein kinase [Candidatus Cryosericum sp.]
MTRLPDSGRWARIAPILEQALDLGPRERAALLDHACAGDPALRAEIEALLRADAEAGSFLDAPVDLSGLPAAPDAAAAGPGAGAGVAMAGRTIGPYRVVREIGRGGMGVVYEAEQQRPRRTVALKVILGGRHVDPIAVRMFQRESDSLARLKHPSIAAVYESGSTEDGEHYFAMELVQGRTLSRYLEEEGPPETREALRRRLALFRKIAAAVAYAHQRGVIHRDLKPSNIIVQPEPEPRTGTGPGSSGSLDTADAAPDVKILDFGLARIADPDAGPATAVTALGSIRGTLPYMSPEQVRGRRDEIDVRTDVYSLGVLLYRMLTGVLPYDVAGADLPAAARIICEQAPRPLRAAAGGRLRFDHDLAVIARKALEKDPGHRYQSVAAFDEDLGRYVVGQPILARPPSAAYQFRLLVLRHKVPFAAAGIILILLVGFAAFAAVQARRIADERDRANREATTARRVSDFMSGLFQMSHPNAAKGREIKVRDLLDEGTARIEKELADEPEVRARLMHTMGSAYLGLGFHAEAARLIQESYEARRRLLGEDNRETLDAMDDLALIRIHRRQFAESEALYQREYEIRRRVDGEDSPATLNPLEGLAWCYRVQGRFAEEQAIRLRVLEGRRRALGDDDRGTLMAMKALAGSYSIAGRPADAEPLLRQALAGLRRLLGEDHLSTLGVMLELANVCTKEKRYAEAEALFHDGLARMRAVLGEDHPLTLNATNDYAMLFEAQGRHAEAESILRDLLARRHRVAGDDNPETVSAMSNLARVDVALGRYAEAGALQRQALERSRRLLGEKDSDTLGILYDLGCTAALRGDRREALSWLAQAVDKGWAHGDRMATDAGLKSLRGDPRFEAIVAKARANEATPAGGR